MSKLPIINLISGGAGFIGSHVTDYLISRGEYVICLDDFSSGLKENIYHLRNHKRFKVLEENILFPIDLKVDRIWHLACPASPKYYYKNSIETSRVCFLGTYNMLELARKNKCKLLFTSSSEIYGNSEFLEQEEIHNGNVNTQSIRSSYAEGKRIAENLCFQYKNIYNLDIKIARIFNTYGPKIKLNDGRVISSFFKSFLNNKPFEIFGDGTQTRSFCYVSDLVNALYLYMDNDENGVINLGNNEEIRITDLASLINKITNKDNGVVFRKFVENEPLRRKPSIELARKKLNWCPKIELRDGLKLTLDYFKKNNKFGL